MTQIESTCIMRKMVWNIVNNYNCLTLLLLNCIEFYIVVFNECVNIIVAIIDFNIIVAFTLKVQFTISTRCCKNLREACMLSKIYWITVRDYNSKSKNNWLKLNLRVSWSVSSVLLLYLNSARLPSWLPDKNNTYQSIPPTDNSPSRSATIKPCLLGLCSLTISKNCRSFKAVWRLFYSFRSFLVLEYMKRR